MKIGIIQAQQIIINAGGTVTPSRTKTRHYDVTMPASAGGGQHNNVSENDLIHLAERIS
jgi:hypothetical protein